MRTVLACLGSSLMLAAAPPVLAQSPFDGTWKGQVASMKIDSKPDTAVLKDGTYRCDTCIPAFSVKADGQFQPVAGKPYWDDIAVAVVDPHTVTYRFRKDGKVVATRTETVSADGNTLTGSGSNTNNAAGIPVAYSGSQTRVGARVPGAHLVSGSWKAAPATSVSDAGLVLTMRVADGMYHQTAPTGETLDATIGGDYAPNVGDPGHTMTKVEQPGPRMLRLTDMRDGKVVDVTTYTVAADGRTMAGAFRDPRDGSRGTFTATKQ